MTNAFTKRFHDRAHAKFVRAGVADVGEMFNEKGVRVAPPLNATLPVVRIYVHEEPLSQTPQTIAVAKNQATIRIVRDLNVPTPGEGFVIVSTGKRYKLRTREQTDEGSWLWVCEMERAANA